jgi:hypothetical protein
MQHTASGALAQSGSRNDSHRAIVSDLEALIRQVQASITLIETAIVGESPLGNQEIAANVVILDDVTPRYVRATAALNACSAGLGVALHFLQDSRTSRLEADPSAERGSRPVRLASQA